MLLTEEKIEEILSKHLHPATSGAVRHKALRACQECIAAVLAKQDAEIARLREEAKLHEINYALERDDNRELREANAELLEGLRMYARIMDDECGVRYPYGEKLIAKHGGKKNE